MSFFFGYFIGKRKLGRRRTHTSRKRSKKLVENPVSAALAIHSSGYDTTPSTEEDNDALASLFPASSSTANGDDSAQTLHMQNLDHSLVKDEEQTVSLNTQDVIRIEETQKDEDSCLILQLPAYMLAEMFSRFSFKEISVLRCVSKDFNSITKSDDFTSLWVNGSDSEVFLRRDTLYNDSVTLSKLDLHKISSSVQRAMNCQHRVFLPKLEPDSVTSNGRYNIVNSCNGFICLQKREPLRTSNSCAICNPVTREYTFIPELEEKEAYILGYVVGSGFGCSADCKHYKVVRLVAGVSASDPFILTAEIYKLGNNSWKTLGKVHNVESCVRSPVFFNGVIHWLCNRLDGSFRILCFNVEAETFGFFRLPWNLSEEEIPTVEFGVLRGHLCLSRVGSWRGIEIWVMRNYGEDSSWRELFTIRLFYESYKVWKPLSWLENNELVLMGGNSSLVLYNLESRTVKEMEIRSDPMISTYKTFTLEPSFGSLKDIFTGGNFEMHHYGLEAEEDIEMVSLQRDDRCHEQWQYSLLSSSFYNIDG